MFSSCRYAGQVGYLMANIKNIQEAQVGDTIQHRGEAVEPLPGFKPCKPMVGTIVSLKFVVSKMWSSIRQNISIGIPLNLSIPTEMGYIQSLVENENSAKLQNCDILFYVTAFLAYMT